MLRKLFPKKAAKIEQFSKDIAEMISDTSPLEFLLFTKYTSFVSEELYLYYLKKYGLDIVRMEPEYLVAGLFGTKVIGFKVTLKQTECVNYCGMNMCDENGCQSRRRAYVELPEVHEQYLEKAGINAVEKIIN